MVNNIKNDTADGILSESIELSSMKHENIDSLPDGQAVGDIGDISASQTSQTSKPSQIIEKEDGVSKSSKQASEKTGRIETSGSSSPTKKRHKLPQEKRSKRITLLLSIVAAIVCWGFVVQTENPTTQLTYSAVPVSLVNEDSLLERDLAIAGETDFYLKVILEGKRSEVLTVKQSDITITADLSSCVKGQNTVAVRVTASGSNIKVANVEPSSIVVTLDQDVTVPKKVMIEYTGTLPENRVIASALSDPSLIEVSGPASEVSLVDSLTATVSYQDILSGKTSVNTPVVMKVGEGESISNVSAAADSVQVSFTVYDVKTVPIHVNIIGEAAELYKLEGTSLPDSIKIQGSSSALSSIESIESEPLDITTLTETTRMKITPILPEGVSLASDNVNLIAIFDVVEYDTKTFDITTDLINLTNVPELYNAAINDTAAVTVTIAGDKEILDTLSTSDITVSADFTGADENTLSVSLSAVCAKETEKVTVSPTSIGVTVSGKEQS